MSVNLGDARVLVYLQRNPGHLPFVHVLGPAMEGNNVQVRRPFCRIVRRPDDSLGFVRGDGDIDEVLADSAGMVDEIVFCPSSCLSRTERPRGTRSVGW